MKHGHFDYLLILNSFFFTLSFTVHHFIFFFIFIGWEKPNLLSPPLPLGLKVHSSSPTLRQNYQGTSSFFLFSMLLFVFWFLDLCLWCMSMRAWFFFVSIFVSWVLEVDGEYVSPCCSSILLNPWTFILLEITATVALL